MKRFYKILLFLLLFLVNIATVVVAETNCSGYIPFLYPDHYCDCKNNISDLDELPMDVMVYDSLWFEAYSDIFTNGFTAYLYSDCDVQFDIYQKCTSTKVLYSVTIPKNQARDVTAESIKNKLEEMGFANIVMKIRVCIYPVGGTGGRLMCYPYNTGYHSTCNDILTLLPGMTFVSSHAEDVYEIKAENISSKYPMYLQWTEEKNRPCSLAITRGSCNGEVIDEYYFDDEEGLYVFDLALLKDVRAKGESLFAHFSHDKSAVGRIKFNRASFVDVLTDTTICQGREFKHGEYVTKESGVYRYDTVKVSSTKYNVYGYDIVFVEPEVQYDTLVLRNGELPYNYRGEMVNDFGEFDLVIETAGECDERVMLNVKHNLTTVASVKDTTMCYGVGFEYKGENYVNDVVVVDSVWSGTKDTLYVNSINVYFSKTPNVVYDTLAVTKGEVTAGFRYQGIPITEFKDYSKTILGEYNCPVEYNLHVCHKVTNVVETVDTIVCDGDVYVHTDGVEYRTSAVLVDSLWKDDDTYLVRTTNVNVISSELAYDTLMLRYSDLPYMYKEQVVIEEMADTTVSLLFGRCSGEVLVHLVHVLDTISAEEDVTLCEGVVYEHNGVKYAQDVTVVDSTWMNRDTLLVMTTNVHFVAPEVAHDTIAVRVSELPYVYREQYVIPTGGFGDHEMVIRNEGECNERINLCVLHRIDTVVVAKDTTICEGKEFEYDGALYYEPVTLVDSAWVNQDTLMVTTTRVSFAAPEAQYDTLGLKTTDLPYIYRGRTVNDFGSYELMITNEGECDELYRLYVYHRIDTIVTVKDSLICYGGRYQYEKDGRVYTAKDDISFGSQVVVNADTVTVDSLHVRFAKQPDNVYDTVVVPTAELIKGYKYVTYNKTVNSADDYLWEEAVNTVTKCKENVYLRVAEMTEEVVDVTVCSGKGYEHKGVVYYEPVTLIDSAWVSEWKYQITTIRLHFVAPEVAYDTIAIGAVELPYDYRGHQIADFGEYDLMIETEGECDEHIMLYVSHLTATVVAERDTTVCQGKAYEHDGELYYEAVDLVDSAWVNRDTMVVTTTRVHFAAPEVVYDTIAIGAAELPYDYRGHQIADFGEHDLMIEIEGECDEHIMLYVSHLTAIVVAERDTTICQGKAYEHDGELYYEAVDLVDSAWVNRDTMVVTTTRVHFAAPEMEYDSVVLEAAELVDGYYYEIADVYVYEAGVYEYEVEVEGECTRLITLAVEVIVPDSIDDVVIESKPKLIMIDGIIYIHHNGDYYSLTGQKLIIK